MLTYETIREITMDYKKELKEIKKRYGEKMSHLCRELFPTILNTPGQLLELLEENFNEDRQLADDIINSKNKSNFKDYIFEKWDEKTGEEEFSSIAVKTPKELLLKAGYDLYECKTVEELEEFKKYYAKNELLCTFIAGGNGQERLDKNMIFFIVHKDIDKIKRSENPSREDDYGTSVLYIEIPYPDQSYSIITSRYNNTVDFPYQTYNYNLNRIAPGLEESFNKKYNLNLEKGGKVGFRLDKYVRDLNGKYYRYNYKYNELAFDFANIFYCPGNIIIDRREVKKYDPNSHIVFEGYILSKEEPPKIINYERRDDKDYQDSFIESIGEIEKVSESKKKDENGEEYLEILITPKGENKKDVILCLDKDNNLISYENENVLKIGDDFLSSLNKGRKLRKVIIPNVREIGENVLCNTYELEEIFMPAVEKIGDDFLKRAYKLTRIDMPAVKFIGDRVLLDAHKLEEISIPNVKEIGDDFLKRACELTRINMPAVKKIGDRVLYYAPKLEEFYASNVKEIGYQSLCKVYKLKIVDMSKVEVLRFSVLEEAHELEKISLQNVRELEGRFLERAFKLKEVSVPKLEKMGFYSLFDVPELEELDLSNVREIEHHVLCYAPKLTKLDLSNVRKIGHNVLYNAPKLEKFYASNVKKMEEYILYDAHNLEVFYAPELDEIGDNSLRNVHNLREIDMSNTRRFGFGVLKNAPCLKKMKISESEDIKIDDSLLRKFREIKNAARKNMKDERDEL